MKREESLLNLICIIAAAGFFVLIAYDLVAGGSIISTDGLFFIVVPLVFAVAFLAVPGMEFLERLLAKRKSGKIGSAPLSPAARAVASPRLSGAKNVPTLMAYKTRSITSAICL